MEGHRGRCFEVPWAVMLYLNTNQGYTKENSMLGNNLTADWCVMIDFFRRLKHRPTRYIPLHGKMICKLKFWAWRVIEEALIQPDIADGVPHSKYGYTKENIRLGENGQQIETLANKLCLGHRQTIIILETEMQGVNFGWGITLNEMRPSDLNSACPSFGEQGVKQELGNTCLSPTNSDKRHSFMRHLQQCVFWTVMLLILLVLRFKRIMLQSVFPLAITWLHMAQDFDVNAMTSKKGDVVNTNVSKLVLHDSLAFLCHANLQAVSTNLMKLYF